MPKERMAFLDYAKALCIFLVVCAHTGIRLVDVTGYIYMTLFFFASGFTAHYEKRSVGQNTKNLFKKLLVPFWVAMLLYGICETVRGQYLGYGDVRLFLPALAGMIYGSTAKMPFISGIGDTLKDIMSYKPLSADCVDVTLPMSCHLWFLPAFFIGAMLFIVYLKTIGKKRKLGIDIIAIVVLLLLASIEVIPGMVQLPYAMGRGFFGGACMIAGRVCQERKIFQFFDKVTPKVVDVLIGLIVVAVASFFLVGGVSSLANSSYGPYGVFGPFIVFIGGVSATILLLLIMKAIESKVNLKAVSFVGQNTMTIYLWHMVFVTILAILALQVTGLEVARDVWFLKIIPTDEVGLILLVAFLALLCCCGVVLIKNKLKQQLSK